jgi:hypothetical protein
VLGMGYHETTDIIKKNSEAFLKKALWDIPLDNTNYQ